MINIPLFKPLAQAPETIPVPKEPPEPMFPARVIDKAQKIYNSQYNMTGPGGKTANVEQTPPTAIPAGGRWGSGK